MRKSTWQILATASILVVLIIVAIVFLTRNTATLAIEQRQTVGDVVIALRLDAATPGERVLEVRAEDSAGRPVPFDTARLSFSMAEMNMGTLHAEARADPQGRFHLRGQFFTMAGNWLVNAALIRANGPALATTFEVPIAAPGELSGPLNPLRNDTAAIPAGQRLYVQNCTTCHGPSGRGDGPAALALNPRPADFTNHMTAGKHTDGQVFLWIKDGYRSGSAMPAWGGRLSDTEIWQLVSYLRTFGQPAAGVAQAGATAQPSAAPVPTTPASVATANESIPPAVLARSGQLWRSHGDGTLEQLTNLGSESAPQYPSISPDNSQIAYMVITQPPVTATSALPTSALFVMPAAGGAARLVWQPDDGWLGAPTWNPDGASINVPVSNPGADPASGQRLAIVKIDLASGAHQLVIPNGLDPSFSRDGTQLTYIQLGQDGYTQDLMVAVPDGSNPRRVIDGALFQGFYAPRFSPDGKQIVVAAVGGPETDSHGVPVRRSSGGVVQTLLGWLEPPTAEAHGMPWDLWVVQSDGTGLRRLTQFYEDLPVSSFSPDGRQLLVMAAGGIYLLDADGTNLRRIDPLGDHGGIDWAR